MQVPVNKQRLLDNFLQYVRVDTTANEGTEGYPSSGGQRMLGALLCEQLKSWGVRDVAQDEHGIVMATLPSRAGSGPAICFNAHLDTSPETSGANVQPQVIENYAGGDIALPKGNRSIRVAECPELDGVVGKTLVTSDGSTLLGGDDKAGVAIIMEMAATWLERPELLHGEVRLLFTCDEEIGRGTLHADVDKISAAACYTFDGGGADVIDTETFSADVAAVRIQGINIHPAIAQGKMVNAIRAAGEFLQQLPAQLSPERTADRDGFLHPYTIQGGVGEVTLRILLRSFETPQLAEYAELIRSAARQTEQAIEGVQISVDVQRQYRNMREGLDAEPRAVEFAVAAHHNLGRQPRMAIIRGGTDGSAFTEKGLPTPNLSSGQHNIHSPLEWACVDEMVAACEIGIELGRLWAAAE